MKNIAVYLGLAILAAACASETPKSEAPVTEGGKATAPSTSQGTGSTSSPAQSADVQGNPLHDPNNVLSKRSVYFDFDSNVVKDEFRPLVQAHARYMVEHRDSRVRIEGNCDERDSREYNLALGQRRAEAVKKIMTVLGAPDARIETISYGEEKPVAMGHDESSWAKNRRADIKYAGE
ncbi:MAG TPA: peptidoglycan-associated lipoprotein Pal [Usitatibacter sp.]|nr:peptidoglycan-associated lipoprotein Pal [Usitatibacter sp.]